MMENGTPRLPPREAIDRFGARLSRWPDQSLANSVRSAALADRAVRRYLDGAAHLDQGLARLRSELDAEIVASGAAERVSERVVGWVGAPERRARWAAVAAALVIAAGLGSAFDFRILAPAEDQGSSVVLLDPLVFGPTEVEAR